MRQHITKEDLKFPLDLYTESPFVPKAFPSRFVQIGKLGLGGSAPIRVQSMTTTNTMDTRATVDQAMALFDAGAELVRITAPGPKDAANLEHIKTALEKRSYNLPLVADIHFSPKAAMIALEHVEKVRINPGNFADTKRFASREYTAEQYKQELERIAEVFLPLVEKAKRYKRVLRIGANHGSLSDRILNRYGDTPTGMVESAMEFIRLAHQAEYYDIVVSMKSSNPQIMVYAYRLLLQYFYKEALRCPVHLGLTEAGSGTDGRMKSAIAIGALLGEGIGDTIRVSLTEDPCREIEAAKQIIYAVDYQRQEQIKALHAAAIFAKNHQTWSRAYQEHISCYAYGPLLTQKSQAKGLRIGSKERQVIFLHSGGELETKEDYHQIANSLSALQAKGCDALWLSRQASPAFLKAAQDIKLPWIQDISSLFLAACSHKPEKLKEHMRQLLPPKEAGGINVDINLTKIPQAQYREQTAQLILFLKQKMREQDQLLILSFTGKVEEIPHCAEFLQEHSSELHNNLVLSFCIQNRLQDSMSQKDLVFAYRLFLSALSREKTKLFCGKALAPILLRASYPELETASVQAPVHLSSLLVDGIGNGICLEIPKCTQKERLQVQLDILQSSRLRLSKTEYISCPSCGRTLFDLQDTTERIRKKTSHLKGLKIAVMGCIVNGPGEMADADFGYVGAGPGKVHLYREKQLVKANISTAHADQELLSLIQESGLWVDP